MLMPAALSEAPQYPITAYLRCTREEVILKAMRLMNNSPADSSLAILIGKPVRIVFKDMQALHPGLRLYDALSWISAGGETVIFINEKHRTAPPAALAAMLAHEAMHNDVYNSIQEEIAGWRREAEVWSALKVADPTLSAVSEKTSPLLTRENRIEQEFKSGTLEAFVKNNAGYKGLPETSPGFKLHTAANPE
jgi:hypothetical protein